MFTGKTEKISVSLPQDLIQVLTAYAEEKAGGNTSGTIREAIIAYLAGKGALRPSPVACARAELEATLDAGVPVESVRETLAGLRARQLTATVGPEGGAL